MQKTTYTQDQELYLKELSIEYNISLEKVKGIISNYYKEFEKDRTITPSHFVSLPILSYFKSNEGNSVPQVETEIVDITRFCRVKPFKERSEGSSKGKRIGCLLCSEPTGKFGTLIISGLSVDEVAFLYKESGAQIAISK